MYKPLAYDKNYIYPGWANGIGWCLALSSILCMPVVAIVRLAITKGTLFEVRKAEMLAIRKLY